ncbi:tannase and feruloyl esterase [Aspergillus novofumigatus IBT 16806]|uniref:Carboxylic ester hydrolase n=1 Tax=Aspergillus novofumigatus (strain IBT 16806) TaxID=1392255 RepID=A0A2I1CJF8_ASPN1|nr:tannase and feruloyl esterase [Aspergillus novofumigatus IBT 16806]PKX97746.1 tannase and feruloyl esterase [Aspergillus novofumigatus IBT 16806]
MLVSLNILSCLSAILAGLASASRCSPAFIDKPDLLGASIINIEAEEAHNYSAVSIAPGSNEGGRYTISFCNVTVTHTHSGWNDTIHTQVWLPLEGWNGRFQALGGGGYSVGFGSTYLTYSVATGFASASSDGGLPGGSGTDAIPTDLSWALSSKNNVDWLHLEDYAATATNDMAVIGQQITKSYYQKPASFSYFAGCSGGGRQGLLMAQRYPNVFDGILAIAPAVNIQNFIPAGMWASQVMNELGHYPSPCEIEAFTKAAVMACDRLDGVEDGIISDPDRCHVTAYDLVGKKYTCNGVQRAFTRSSAKVIQAAWSGSLSVSKKYGWPGVNHDATLGSHYLPTECSTNNTCHLSQSALFGSWIKYLVAKDPEFEINNMTRNEFLEALHYSAVYYTSMLGTNDPDLSKFKANGGKMITWQGLADEAIPPNGPIAYYKEVLKNDPKAQDFYRFFEAPGVGHCYGGLGPIPNGAMSQLMEWVEKDHPPATLHATKGSNNTARDLCPYPLRQKFIGGDPRNATSFTCTDEYSTRT